jgi:hypothetical protein
MDIMMMHDKDYCKGYFGSRKTKMRQIVTDQPKTLSVPEAGRLYFDLARNASYEAARRGEIPTLPR